MEEALEELVSENEALSKRSEHYRLECSSLHSQIKKLEQRIKQVKKDMRHELSTRLAQLESARELNQRLMAEINVVKHANREALEELRKYNGALRCAALTEERFRNVLERLAQDEQISARMDELLKSDEIMMIVPSASSLFFGFSK